jgi:hypothetical protein
VIDANDDGAAIIQGRSPFLPCALLATAFVVWLAFQTWSLLGERSQLSLAHATQESPTAQAKNLRAALDTLAVTTQRLAGEGSVSARTVVDELAKRGVTINPAGAASAPK